MINNTKFLYIITFPDFEEELCWLELSILFNESIRRKFLLTYKNIDPTLSSYIKRKIEIIATNPSIENLIKDIRSKKLNYTEFKVEYINEIKKDIEFTDRVAVLRNIGDNIIGSYNLHNPKVVISIGKKDGIWYLGKIIKKSSSWQERTKKPFSYCNSLSTRLAKAIVNIAGMGDLSKKIIDPCCGVGTAVIEGLVIGYNITGYEINKKLTEHANKNLEHFNLSRVVKNIDMHATTTVFDSSLIDIPYGVFGHTNREEQLAILQTARRISKRMVLVTFENIDNLILLSDFKIINRCKVRKGRFTREIVICE